MLKITENSWNQFYYILNKLNLKQSVLGICSSSKGSHAAVIHNDMILLKMYHIVRKDILSIAIAHQNDITTRTTSWAVEFFGRCKIKVPE